MKNLRTYVLCTCMILCSFFAVAQDQKVPVREPEHNRPHLFDNLPARMPFNPESIMGLTGKQSGTVIQTSLSADAPVAFEGKITSSAISENGKVQRIVIQSTNYAGATLSMSRVVKPDGSIQYNGRLISFKHQDAYVLQQSNGRYELVKKDFYELVNE